MTRDRSDDSETIGTLAAGRAAFVWRRQIADTDTPVSAALALIETGRGDFLLESVEGGQTRGRHSLIGLAPDLIFRAEGDRAEINGESVEGGAIAALRQLVERCRADVPPELPGTAPRLRSGRANWGYWSLAAAASIRSQASATRRSGSPSPGQS
ncbi:MAG TPA: hypothetical protein VFT73_06380, partial [Sphingomonas sp.]|nr:hypothetical protein [Sphingomonas sp.]